MCFRGLKIFYHKGSGDGGEEEGRKIKEEVEKYVFIYLGILSYFFEIEICINSVRKNIGNLWVISC